MKNYQQGYQIERYTIDFLVFETLRFIRDALANGKISKYVEYFEFLLGVGSRYYTIEESRVLQERKEKLYREMLEIKNNKELNQQTIQHEILMRRFLFCKQNENFLFSLISHIGAIKIERTGEINFDITDYELLSKVVKYGGSDSDYNELLRTKGGKDVIEKWQNKTHTENHKQPETLTTDEKNEKTDKDKVETVKEKMVKETLQKIEAILPSEYEKDKSDEELIEEDGFDDGEKKETTEKPNDIPDAEEEVVFEDETEGDEEVFEENIETDRKEQKDDNKEDDNEEIKDDKFNKFKIYKGDK